MFRRPKQSRSCYTSSTDELLPRFGVDTDKEAAAARRERCRQRPVRILCEASEFGCCPDGLAMAAGPFHKDCPEVREPHSALQRATMLKQPRLFHAWSCRELGVGQYDAGKG